MVCYLCDLGEYYGWRYSHKEVMDTMKREHVRYAVALKDSDFAKCGVFDYFGLSGIIGIRNFGGGLWPNLSATLNI